VGAWVWNCIRPAKNSPRQLALPRCGRPGPAALAGGTHIGPGPGALHMPPMPTWAMITVIAGWIIGWSAIGAWKMATRDA